MRLTFRGFLRRTYADMTMLPIPGVTRLVGSYDSTLPMPDLPRAVPANTGSLTVEGFPRSGNTYLAYATQLAWPGLVVKSHTHSPAPVREAARTSCPALVPIRDPFDAVASLLVYRWNVHLSGARARDALRDYVWFHSRIPSESILIEFDSLTPASLMARFQEVAINFHMARPLEIDDSEVRSLVSWSAGLSPYTESHRELTVSLPDSRRNARIQEAKEVVLEQTRALARAQSAYHKLLSRRVALS